MLYEVITATIIYGVNHDSLKAGHAVISNASCTSNCLIPILSVIDAVLGIDSGSITTIHSAIRITSYNVCYTKLLRGIG